MAQPLTMVQKKGGVSYLSHSRHENVLHEAHGVYYAESTQQTAGLVFSGWRSADAYIQLHVLHKSREILEPCRNKTLASAFMRFSMLMFSGLEVL